MKISRFNNKQTVSFEKPSLFIQNLKKVDYVYIEIPFFEDGAIDFEFNVENLEW